MIRLNKLDKRFQGYVSQVSTHKFAFKTIPNEDDLITVDFLTDTHPFKFTENLTWILKNKKQNCEP